MRNTILCGDVLAQLATLPDESVHMVVTSPPYWGLRSYGTETWEGGELEHVHRGRDVRAWAPGSAKQASSAGSNYVTAGDCECGAIRQDKQLGLEPTPELYVAHMVAVFREVRRVLRKDGTLWLNLGSSYDGSPRGNKSGDFSTSSLTNPQRQDSIRRGDVRRGGRNGSGDREQSDSIGHDSTYESLCDECEAVLSLRSPGTDGRLAQEHPALVAESSLTHKERQTVHSGNSRSASLAVQSVSAIEESPSSPTLEDEPLPSSLESMPLESSLQRREGCRHCANCGACLDVLASPSREFRLCVRRRADLSETGLASPSTQRRTNSGGTASTVGASADRKSDKASDSSSYLDFTTLSHHLKSKDLVMIPSLVALAFQADGWWLRSEITWCKTAPMPESVRDRPTSATEKIFLLSKSERYYYDIEAIREPFVENPERIRNRSEDGYNSSFSGGRFSNGGRSVAHLSGRNALNYWLLNPEPFPEAHFATFPTELAKRCILAGSSERGVCSECGAPWRRVTDKIDANNRLGSAYREHDERDLTQGHPSVPSGKGAPERVLVGWQPTCKHEAPTERAIVLDPFMGAGTTALVALQAGRDFVGIELNPAYVEMAEKRIAPYRWRLL